MNTLTLYLGMTPRYSVEYLVKTTRNKNGEFYNEQEAKQYAIDSVSDDLNEIFTDLFYIHRFDSIVGIEILGVQKKLPYMKVT